MMNLTFKNVTIEKKNEDNNYIKILSDLTFDLSGVKSLTIFGQSGAGKSTLLELISTFQYPTKGEIEYCIDNKRILFSNKIKKKNLKIIRKNLKIIYQNSNIQFFRHTVWKEILFTLKILGVKKDEINGQAEDFWKKMNFDDSLKHISPLNLSGGQKKLFLINLLLISKPNMFILDEPTSNLDNENKRDLLKRLENLVNNNEMLPIIVSHDITLKDYSTHSIILLDGKMLFFGKSINITKDIFKKAGLI